MDQLSCLNKDSIQLLAKNNILLPLIKQELLAEKIKEFKLSDQIIEEVISNFCRQKNIKNTEELDKILNNQKVDKQDFVKEITVRKKFNEYAKQEYGHLAESHFLKRKNDLDTVVYSLIRIKDPNKAKELVLNYDCLLLISDDQCLSSCKSNDQEMTLYKIYYNHYHEEFDKIY